MLVGIKFDEVKRMWKDEKRLKKGKIFRERKI